jgi:CelD/BcsL family acetyltransferase involved in cellulose biosynthesis/GNAT superfamily N-acetyltransferase
MADAPSTGVDDVTAPNRRDDLCINIVGPSRADVISDLYLDGFKQALAPRLGRVGRWWCVRRWRKRTQHARSVCVVATHDQVPVGFAYGFWGQPYPPKVGSVTGMEILPLFLSMLLAPAVLVHAFRNVAARVDQRSRASSDLTEATSSEQPSNGEHLLWMEPITVHSSARGRGVGPRLFGALSAAASARGCRQIGWAVANRNWPMLAMSYRVGGHVIASGAGEHYFRAPLPPADARPSRIGDASLPIRTESIRGTDEIAAIGRDWDALLRQIPNASPHLSYAWYQSWISDREPNGTPHVVTMRRGDRLIGLLPLVIRRSFGARVATIGGASRPSYQGLLAPSGDKEIVNQCAKHCAQSGDFDVLVLENVSSLDAQTAAFIDALDDSDWHCEHVTRNICHRIRLDPSFDDYFRQQKSAKARYNLRRSERLLHAQHSVEILRFDSHEINEAVMTRVAEIQSGSWMPRRGADCFRDRFYQQLVLRLAEDGRVRAWIMQIDGHDAAFVLATAHSRTLIYEWTAFRLEYERFSIGRILTSLVIRDTCDRGFEVLDFLHGDADYKRYWANESHTVSRVALGRGARGRLVARALAATWCLRRNEHLRRGYRRLETALRSDRSDRNRRKAA